MKKNLDHDVVAGFGDEWSRFDQSVLSPEEQADVFEAYFAIFPWSKLNASAVGFDLGCGSGRWAKLVAPRVGTLHCIDASPAALNVAKQNLRQVDNCRFHVASVDEIPLEDASCDFAYSLGVLHHVPDTAAAITACTAKLKRGAPFLIYLYYRFDNRPFWFRIVWKFSDVFRIVISRAGHPFRYFMSQFIAAVVYYPLARLALLMEKAGVDVDSFFLSSYRNRSFYMMRTDALDRFGTRLEQRFNRDEIRGMMERAGLVNIVFSDQAPYWCAVGTKR